MGPPLFMTREMASLCRFFRENFAAGLLVYPKAVGALQRKAPTSIYGASALARTLVLIPCKRQCCPNAAEPDGED